jgi:transcriptional regulator with XRE-family HTH domain
MARKKAPIVRFRERLKDERERLGLSQVELEEKLKRRGVDLPQSAISKMERGERAPHPDELVAIAKVFGLTVDTMLGHKGGNDDSLDYALRSMRETNRRSVMAIRLVANDIDAVEAEVFSYAFPGNATLALYLSAFHRHINMALVALRLTEMLTDIDAVVPPGFVVTKDEVTREQVRAESNAARERLRLEKQKMDAAIAASPHGQDVLTDIFRMTNDRLFPADGGQLVEDDILARFLSEFVLPKAGL